MSYTTRMFWSFALGVIVSTSVAAQDLDIAWPDTDSPPYKVVALVPGCDGFDGSGNNMKIFDEQTNHGDDVMYVKNEGEADNTALEGRIALYKQKLRESYEKSSERFGKLGMAVMKIDYTQEVNCSHLGPLKLKDSLNKVAMRITRELSKLRTTHQGKVKSDQVYVVANSLGAAGVLQIFKDWSKKVAAETPNRAVLYFPFCTDVIGNWKAEIPTTILVGKLDDVPAGYNKTTKKMIGLAEDCREQKVKADPKLTYREYDNAYHGFDLEGSSIKTQAKILAIRYRFTTYAYSKSAADKAAVALKDALR